MDYGHAETDKKLKTVERKIQAEYKRAAKEVQASMDKYLAHYAKNDAEMLAKFKAGEITKKELTDWRTKQMLITDKWRDMENNLTNVYMNADKVAAGLIQDHRFDVYALNYNYGIYEIEESVHLNTAFALYDKDTVARLVKDNPKLLPPPGKTTSEKIRRGELQKWNQRQIRSVMTQGILQGESIDKISKRLAKAVSEKNSYSHIRAARTMTTGAENAGRLDSYERAEEMGIKMGKTWLAVHDEKTRDSHVEIDGESVPVDDPFVLTNSDGSTSELMFPGDPDGDAEQVYNCRCTMVGTVLSVNGVDISDLTNEDDWEDKWDIDYEAWKNSREQASAEPDTDEKPVVDNPSIAYTTLSTKLEAQGIDYKTVPKLSQPLSEDKIIQKLAGGDRTTGSCASLGLAYAGQKCGFDVTDFRGGHSQEFFSRKSNILNVLRLNGVDMITETAKSTITAGNKLLKHVEIGKEYYFVAGRHAAIVKRTKDNKLQYLELQSGYKDGWNDFNGNPRYTLKTRFGCNDGRGWTENAYMVDIKDFKGSEEFRDLLGYINTDADKQMKGSGGYAK